MRHLRSSGRSSGTLLLAARVCSGTLRPVVARRGLRMPISSTSPTNLEVRVSVLETNRIKDAARIRKLENWVDTVSSPLWKRICFVALGYRFRQLGVWYHACWNIDAWEYEDARN